ncbi:MAG TPA: DUF4157 domain-containing protein, partial [Kofleriaceae bacterium]|nr:DUF4157 domain-containing protein [Kofleriaceae bacterium]
PGKRSLTHRFIGADWADDASGGESGAAPDARVRAQVEATTGGDLSAARVHTDSTSQADAAALRARAFTVGTDIHFAAGQYQPGTPAGDALLAHELVHTLQQGGGAPTAQLKASDVSQESDAAEVEADRIAQAAVSGAGTRMAPVQRAAPISLAPERLSGNPAEKTDSTGAATTTHRSIGVADAANAPPVGPAATETRAASVKVKATETAPLHFAGAACPLDSAIYEEDTSNASPPPAGFTAITGFDGTVAGPKIAQEASPSIYINGTPTVDDVQQGGIGDCYNQALIQSIVARDPGKITSMMVPDGRGGATVTFWRAQAHTKTIMERIFGGAPARDWIQVAVTVSDQLAVNISNNRVMGAQLRCAPSPKSQDWFGKVVSDKLEIHRKDLFDVARWAPLLEKAFARFAQAHGQYGGAAAGKSGGSGYTAIDSGSPFYAMWPFYGPQADDPANRATFQGTSYTPGGNVVTANAAALDQLILLQGRGSETRPGERDAPIITAMSNIDPLITRLTAAIPAAQADPDYVNVDAARQGLVTATALAITTWNALPPDPAPPAAQPKATAKTAIGTSCGRAVMPGIDESAGEQDILNRLFRGWAAPVRFEQGGDAMTPAAATGVKNLSQNLRVLKHPVVDVKLEGHSSAEGSEAVNMDLSQKRVDAVETQLLAGGALAPHTSQKAAKGEEGATNDPSWRRVDIDIQPTGHKTNSLLDSKRSRVIQDMAQLMVNLSNMGTDNSPGQRNVYGDHVYSVVSVNIVTTTGVTVPLSQIPAANRPALYPLVDADVSTVQLRNPHRGNEPDRRNNRTPERPGDGPPSGAAADGLFTMTLREFFLNFTSVHSGVFPRS